MNASSPVWHKSSYSNAHGECVEVRETAHGTLVRDTQNRNHGHLGFSSEEWMVFMHEVKSGAL